MAFNKITDYESNIKDLPVRPSTAGITPDQLKRLFDGRTDKEVKLLFNQLIDDLLSDIAAGQLGAMQIDREDDSANNLQAKLSFLKNHTDTLVMKMIDTIRDNISEAQRRADEAAQKAEVAQDRAEIAAENAATEAAEEAVFNVKELLEEHVADSEAAKLGAETAQSEAENSQKIAMNSQIMAESAQYKSEEAQAKAEAAADKADTYSTQAQASATNAFSFSTQANTSREMAEKAEREAKAAQGMAEIAKGEAEAAREQAIRAENAAVNAAQDATDARNAASVSAGYAQNAESASAGYAQNAATSAGNAKESENAAKLAASKASYVYVGAGEMPEGCNVQVDPEGDAIDVQAMVNNALQEAKESGEFKGDKGDKGEPGASAQTVNYDINVKAVNHRGYSAEAPENTIPAYIMSKQKGFTYVECDVSFTSDGVAVLLHDATIDRTSDGSGNISTMTYAEAVQHDYGSWKDSKFEGTHLPTFREFILLCKNLGLHPYIELKSDGGYTQENITSIVNEVKACGMVGKVTYISFNGTYLDYVKTADANARLGYVMSAVTTAKLDEAVALRTGTNDVFIDAKYSTLTTSNVNACISRDLPLEVWTVNDALWLDAMNPYISGVTTDALNVGEILYEKNTVYIPHDFSVPYVSNITLSQSQLEMNSFDSQTLKATLEPVGVSAPVEWTSSNEDVARVANGVITPNFSGEVIITATAGKVSASCIVTVNVDDLSAPEGYEAVRLLKATDIVYGIGSSWKPVDCDNNPPYTVEQKYRAGYYATDIPVEYGYAYRVDFISTHSGTMVGQQIANTKLTEYINNPSADISNATLKANLVDSGWLENGADFVIPEEVNGYPLESMRLTFKQGSSTYKGGEIKQVLISRKKLTV